MEHNGIEKDVEVAEGAAASDEDACTVVERKPDKDKDKDKEEPHAGFLNVVFHGAFCFFEIENNILVRTANIKHMGDPKMPSEHVYLAGNWLGESTYEPRKDYQLKGVEPGYARFPREHNLIIKGGTPAKIPEGIYAEFLFPYPLQIYSVQCLPVKNLGEFFEGTSFPKINDVKEISTIQIFTYRFKNHLDLQLVGHAPWTAKRMLVGNIATLHLWSEPDHTVCRCHVGNAFSDSIKMFDSVDLKLKKSENILHVEADDLPYGTRVEEMDDLVVRLYKLARLGKAFKAGDDLRAALVKTKREITLLSGTDLHRCSHIVGAS